MELNKQNETVTYSGAEIVNILKELDYILISLHGMGSYYAEQLPENRQAYEHETTAFIDRAQVCSRLAAVRAKLSERFDRSPGADDMDDIERACEEIPYWNKPGDCSGEFWVR